MKSWIIFYNTTAEVFVYESFASQCCGYFGTSAKPYTQPAILKWANLYIDMLKYTSCSNLANKWYASNIQTSKCMLTGSLWIRK